MSPRPARHPPGRRWQVLVVGGICVLGLGLGALAGRWLALGPSATSSPPLSRLEPPPGHAAPVAAAPHATPTAAATARPPRPPVEPAPERTLPGGDRRSAAAPPSAPVADTAVIEARRLAAQGLLAEAAATLERQLTAAEHPRLRLELAALRLRMGEHSEAHSNLERVPPDFRDAVWYALSGQALYQLARLPQAEQALEQALERGAPVAELLARVRTDRSRLGDDRGRRSEHFSLVIQGGGEPRLAHSLLAAAERSYRELARELAPPGHDAIPLVLYTRRSFQEVTRAPDWAGGVYDGKVRLPVAGIERVTPQLERLLRHELTHALVFLRAGPACPSWLQEGLAQHYEGLDFEQRWRALGRPPAEQLAAAVDRSQPSLFYARSLSRVDYIRGRYGQLKLGELLDRLRQGESFEQAVPRLFHRSAETFERDWYRWLERR